MRESIGKVVLNFDDYIGEDLYSDGEIEDQLLEIVQKYTVDEYPEVIAAEKSWPILYHLSNIRENILEWYPFKKNASVFEVGAGCGAITGALVRNVNRVVANDLSKKRSTINATRNKEASNLEILVGNFDKVCEGIDEKFDYITLIGVFEYAASYIEGKEPYKVFLNKVNDLLKEDGKILIAIENRMGLKYFAGCKEDHVGKYFEGIEGYSETQGVKTFTKQEWIDLLQKNGFNDFEFYYPYPDYKLPMVIYSDDYLPKRGELANNIRNFDSDRYIVFDEAKAFDTIIESQLFPEFSNSYFISVNRKG